MDFRLRIALGNAEMQTGFDVAEALRSVADSLEDHDDRRLTSSRPIFDANGNRVGSWAVCR